MFTTASQEPTMQTSSAICHDLDVIAPRTGADGWHRQAEVVLDLGSDSEPAGLWTRECAPGGGWPELGRRHIVLCSIPLGHDYRPLADDRRVQDLLYTIVSDDETSEEDRETAIDELRERITDLADTLPAAVDASDWVDQGYRPDVVAEIQEAGGPREWARQEIAGYAGEVTIIGGEDALAGCAEQIVADFDPADYPADYE
jgi:hypothetical protein